MIRMDEINKIRKAFYNEGLTINAISLKFKRSWATIRTIVESPREELEEIEKKKRNRESTVITQEVKDAINHLLEQEKQIGTKKKQRYRTKSIYRELVEKGIYKGSERRLQELVKEIRKKHGLVEPKSFLPLEFELGSVLQVDHGEVDCIISNHRMIMYLFVGTVPGTHLRFCQGFGTKAQEAWGEFHERCFRFYGGIFSRVMYDNDSVLIKDCTKGQHIETSFALSLSEHYGSDSVFCNPASGNEKGSVENGVGYCRRNYLPGCPSYDNFESLNEYLEQRCLNEIEEQSFISNDGSQSISVKLKANLKPILPPKIWRQRDSRQVNRYQMVEVYSHFYSVPEQFVGSRVRVSIRAFSIDISNEEGLIVSHKRRFSRNEDSLLLEHYLEQLRKKPGALWDCKITKDLLDDKALEVIWLRTLERYPLRDAQKHFIEILYLKKTYQEAHWKAGIEKAAECGAYDPKAIESIIKMHISPRSNIEIEAKEKLRHIEMPILEFNLSQYAVLSEKVLGLEEEDFIFKPDSRHGHAGLGKFNAPIADQIMDDYFLQKVERNNSEGDFVKGDLHTTIKEVKAC